MHQQQDPVLRVDNVGKLYRLWSTPASRLWVPLLQRLERILPGRFKPWLQAQVRRRLQLHHALEGVSFSLMPGEALGIIGLNGSGKSTLLQIIAGVLPATAGRVSASGRIAALLELGSGFSPDLTGRENVVINAAILGMSQSEIDRKIPEILAFADIGDYVDQPVKTYSSGMAVRLAFAVQVHVDPDILIVDEALAVGDAAFQAKAMARIEEVLARGTTLLFVGHDLNAVRVFCQRAMLLEKGRVVAQGLPEEVIEEYLFRIHAQAAGQGPRPERTAEGFRSEAGAILSVHLGDGLQHRALRLGDSLPVSISLFAEPGIEHAACIVDILDPRGLPLSGRRIRLPERGPDGRLDLTVDFSAQLQRGVYRVRVRLVEVSGQEHSRVLGRFDAGVSFQMVDDSRDQFTGLFPLPATVRFDSGAPPPSHG